MCSAIFLRMTLIDSTRSPICGRGGGGAGSSAGIGGAGAAGTAAGASGLAGAAGCAGAAVVLPDSMKLRMSFLVTRPLRTVPSSWEMSTLCSCAILRTSGLDFVRRSSSTVGSADCAGCAGGGGGAATGGAGGGGSGLALTGGGGGSAPPGSVDTDFTDGPEPSPSNTATTVLTSTVSPSLNRTSVNVPAAGDGISASTLSVEISNDGSSRSTRSPTFFRHFFIVPSALDSPICGMTTSVLISSPSYPCSAVQIRGSISSKLACRIDNVLRLRQVIIFKRR